MITLRGFARFMASRIPLSRALNNDLLQPYIAKVPFNELLIEFSNENPEVTLLEAITDLETAFSSIKNAVEYHSNIANGDIEQSPAEETVIIG